MIKHLLIIAGLLVLNLSMVGQSTANLIIFSEDGDPFFAFVNGVKQNNSAETNVKITGLASNASIRIQFENTALPQLKQTMVLESGFEHTARIKRDKNKQLKLSYFGQIPITDAHSDNMATVDYHTADYTTPAKSQDSRANEQISVNDHSGAGTNSGTEMVAIKTTATPAAVNINMTGVALTMSVSDNAMQTTTQTTSSKSVKKTSSTKKPTPVAKKEEKPVVATTTLTGCQTAMSAANFSKLKSSVESKPFSDTKMSTAKVATKSNCLSVDQIKEICGLFSMDDDKLTYAKYAYAYCVDKGNYYQVSDVFSFSSTTESFNQFLDK